MDGVILCVRHSEQVTPAGCTEKLISLNSVLIWEPGVFLWMFTLLCSITLCHELSPASALTLNKVQLCVNVMQVQTQQRADVVSHHRSCFMFLFLSKQLNQKAVCDLQDWVLKADGAGVDGGAACMCLCVHAGVSSGLHFSTVREDVAVRRGGELHQWHQKRAAGDQMFKGSVHPHTPTPPHTHLLSPRPPRVNTNTHKMTGSGLNSLWMTRLVRLQWQSPSPFIPALPPLLFLLLLLLLLCITTKYPICSDPPASPASRWPGVLVRGEGLGSGREVLTCWWGGYSPAMAYPLASTAPQTSPPSACSLLPPLSLLSPPPPAFTNSWMQ